MIKKIISAVTAGITAAVIAVNPLCQTFAFEVYEDPVQKTIFLKQGNIAEFVFMDETGQELYDYEIVMKNSAGVEVGRFVDDYGNEFTMLNSSGIRKADKWQITEKYLADLVSPLVPRYVSQSYYDAIGGEPVKTLYELHDYSANNPIKIDYTDEDEDYYNHYRVFSYPQGETTAFTIPANKMGIFVDKKWENFNSRGYYKMGSDGSKKYFDNNEMFGSLKVWEPKKDPSQLRIGVAEVTNSYNLIYPPKLQSKKTEYIKCKMNVSELFCLEDQLQIMVGDDGKFLYDDITFNLRKRTSDKFAMIVITSGACTTVTIPGSAGNVEFYVERGSRQMAAEIYVCYTNGEGVTKVGGFRNKGYYGKVHEFRIETPQIHDEGGILIDNIPAGRYTLELKSYNGNSYFSQVRTIDISNSNYQQLIAEVFDTNITLKKGDTDGNNVVDSSDASRILAEYSAMSTGSVSSLSAEQRNAADVNYDGKIDSTDASKVLEHYANISTGGTGIIK